MIEFEGEKYNKIDTDPKLKADVESKMDLEHSEIVGYYRKSGNIRLLFRCKIYDEYYTKTKSKFHKNKNCIYCQSGKNNVYNKKSFIKKINELYPNEYCYTSNSIWNKKDAHIELRHKCGIIKSYNKSALIQGNSRCDCLTNRITKDKFYALMEEQGVRDEYEIIGEIKNNEEPVAMIHKPCGEVCHISYTNFKGNTRHPNGSKCYNCYIKSITKKDEDFKKELFDLYKGDIESIEKYKNNSTEINFKCTKCGYIWCSTPNNILCGNSHCSNCSGNDYKGETFIKEFLDSNGILYTQKVKLSCKYKRKLEADFIINNRIYLEFDGEQHFKSVGFDKKSSGDKLDVRQKRDSIKTQYCIDNKLTHIRIPYTQEKNLETILDSIINNSYLENKDIYIIQEGKLINNLDCYDYLDVNYLGE